MNRLRETRHVFPSSRRRGGCAASLLAGPAQTGWSGKTKRFSRPDHPGAIAPPLLHQEGNTNTASLLLAVCFLLVFALPSFAQDPRVIVEEVQKRTTTMSQHYEGTLRVVDSK